MPSRGQLDRRGSLARSPIGHGSNGIGLDGERRPANLEDFFVLLTGEEIA